MKLSRKSMPPPRIEMLPLIDIVFLLLVFFIYAMLSMAVHHGQGVDLPQSGSAVSDPRDAVAITIKNGAGRGLLLAIDEEAVSLEQLADRLRQKKTENHGDGEREVQIFADKSISYQELFRVLDRVKEAGLSRISLQAETEAATP